MKNLSLYTFLDKYFFFLLQILNNNGNKCLYISTKSSTGHDQSRCSTKNFILYFCARISIQDCGEPHFQDCLLEDFKCLLHPGRLPEESLLIFFHLCLAENKLQNIFFKLKYLNEKEQLDRSHTF